MVLMENVAEMKNGFDQTYTQEILTRLGSAGYRVTYQLINAADYGVPQRRRRAFFFAHREGLHISFPAPTHSKSRDSDREDLRFPWMKGNDHVTVWDAIGDLPSVAHNDDRQEHEYACAPFTEYQVSMRRGRKAVTNHKPRTLALTQYQRLASIGPGEGINELPDHLRPRSGYSGAYGRLTEDMIAPTITRWVFHPGSGRFGHPKDIRVITIREAARLQGFPDDFEFIGTYTQQAGQLGNAVPPLLVQKIGESILRQSGQAFGRGLGEAANISTNCSIDNLSFFAGNENFVA